MTLKELTINALDYLINVKGLSKRQISRVIGVHPSRLTYVYGAKWVDPKLLEALHKHWPELKPQKPEELEKYLDVAKREVDSAANDNTKVDYLQQQLGDVKAILVEIENEIKKMTKNK